MKSLSNPEFEILLLFFDHNNKILETEAVALIQGIFESQWHKFFTSRYLKRMMKKKAIHKACIDGNMYYVSVTEEEFSAFLKKSCLKLKDDWFF